GCHLFRLGKRWPRQRDDPAITVDHCRDAHVDGAGNAPATLDGAKAAEGQVLLVFAGTVEPTIVGHIYQEVYGRIVTAGAHVLPPQKRVGILVADDDTEVVGSERETGEGLARPNAVRTVVRRKTVHPRQRLAEGDIFTEGDAVDLVVAPGRSAVC